MAATTRLIRSEDDVVLYQAVVRGWAVIALDYLQAHAEEIILGRRPV